MALPPARAVRYRLEYAAVASLGLLFRAMPLAAAQCVAWVIARAGYALMRSRRNEAKRRIRLVMGGGMTDRKALLERFIPIYLNVLLSSDYADYLGEIIIEGHTDSVGTYENNLKLSQNRALQVALYVLSMPNLTAQQKGLLQQIMTATGKSEADLIYDQYGDEDADASRRVEFKFSLKDSEMIEQMQRILQENDLEN